MEAFRDELVGKMNQCVEALKKEFTGVRTGRANPALFDSVKVDYYGTATPLKQLANITVPEARLVTIVPFDKNVIGEMEKALQKADLGLNPQNDGKVIRISIPPLNEERRHELVKLVRKMAEDIKVSIRNIRRDGNETMKKRLKKKELSKDDFKRQQENIQEVTDKYIALVDENLKVKEEEILKI